MDAITKYVPGFRFLLEEDVAAWNEWRQRDGRPTLFLMGAELHDRDLRGANLKGARLIKARLSEARLDGADLSGADLNGASLRKASLVGANLSGAALRHANLSGANIQDAILDGCEIYGTGLWGLEGKPASTLNLRIDIRPEPRRSGAKGGKGKAPVAVVGDDDDANGDKPAAPGSGAPARPMLEVDHLDAAQFLFVLLDNPRIGHAFDALNDHIVLILGRFGDGHLERLNRMRDRLLATGDYVPIVFDFEGPPGRSLTETVAGFAHLSLFVIADLTNPRSVPQELSHIVPFLPSVPVVPLVPKLTDVYAMFEHFQRYPWVLTPVEYGTPERLMEVFDVEVMQAGREAAERLRLAARRWKAG